MQGKKMATYKGVEINLKPTEGMAAQARKFFKWREEGKKAAQRLQLRVRVS
jgi:hypothetical protein